MGWEDRDYATEDDGSFGAKLRRGLRRVFGNGENPFDWALPLYTAWGIRVRVSIFYVLWMLIEVIQWLPLGTTGLGYRMLGLFSLFVLVLLHEYGHCLACRRVGGTANQILMWPLGGLASCDPPHNWRAHLITTLAGPGVNAALMPVLGGLLLALGAGWEAVIFNPFNPMPVMLGLHLSNGQQPYWLFFVWWLYFTNAALLAFNMLLPMYPMDGGRTLHALLWRTRGHRKAMDIATKVGFVTAGALAVFAMAYNNVLLLGIAIFGAFTCWVERRRLTMATGGDPALADYDFDRGYGGLPAEDGDDAPPSRKARQREKQRKKAEEEQAELDRILAKIARSGMSSLSKGEKRWLARATEQRRSG